MKKIVIILSVIVAFVASSCQNTFDPTITLALDNQEVNIPKSVSDTAEPVHYARVTSNGRWEATLETEDGNSWCWLREYYTDAKGKKVNVVEPISHFDGMEGRWNKVKGKGTVWLPLCYVTSSTTRYAVLTVRNIKTGEVKQLRITQK